MACCAVLILGACSGGDAGPDGAGVAGETATAESSDAEDNGTEFPADADADAASESAVSGVFSFECPRLNRVVGRPGTANCFSVGAPAEAAVVSAVGALADHPGVDAGTGGDYLISCAPRSQPDGLPTPDFRTIGAWEQPTVFSTGDTRFGHCTFETSGVEAPAGALTTPVVVSLIEAFAADLAAVDCEDMRLSCDETFANVDVDEDVVAEPDPAEQTASAPEADAEPPAAAPIGDCGGPAEQGTVTGVNEWVRMRARPSIDSRELGRLEARSTVTYFPDTITFDGTRRWVTVWSTQRERCANVAASFIKGSDGMVLDPNDPLEYVIRALTDLEPEAFHADRFFTSADATESFPVDAEARDRALSMLREVGRINPRAAARPDPTHGNAAGVSPECFFSDGAVCKIDVFDGSDLVASAYVDFYGRGVTGLRVERFDS